MLDPLCFIFECRVSTLPSPSSLIDFSLSSQLSYGLPCASTDAHVIWSVRIIGTDGDNIVQEASDTSIEDVVLSIVDCLSSHCPIMHTIRSILLPY